jgi:hypothetical protein
MSGEVTEEEEDNAPPSARPQAQRKQPYTVDLGNGWDMRITASVADVSDTEPESGDGGGDDGGDQSHSDPGDDLEDGLPSKPVDDGSDTVSCTLR